jgi:26S proteasome regulatory subunit N12
MSQQDTSEVEAAVQKLRAAFLKDPVDVKQCLKSLSSIKVLLLRFNLVPPFSGDKLTQKQLLLARETLEIATLVSIEARDFAAFERHVAQLKPYYVDYASLLPASERQWPILGLNLLGLLAHNRIGDFHTELELIPTEFHGNLYIKYALELEQRLMEGSYQKVLGARRSAPMKTLFVFH